MVEFFFVDDGEAIVDVWYSMNIDSRVLRVVFIEVEAKGRGDALGVNSCSHAFRAFGED